MRFLRMVLLAAMTSTASATPTQAIGPGPEAGPHEWPARAAENHTYSRGRGHDQFGNPDYQARWWPLVADFLRGQDPKQTRIATDPYRFEWGQTRGTWVPVSYPNRYGASIRANLWMPNLPFQDPVTGAQTQGPLPAVVLVSGTDANQMQYLGMAHGLAEAGYVVMTFDPQGQGESDTQPNPTSVYCDPSGTWKQPQELGVREEGACAGERRSQGDGSSLYDERFYLGQRVNGPRFEDYQPHYTRTHARFIFGAFDAVAWLLSDANPNRDLIDATRLGIVGHSLGAHTALNAGNGDPLRRFSTVVAWDTFGPMLDTVSPTVPTMIHHGDREEFYGPYLHSPDPDSLPASGWRARFRTSGIDVAQIVLRGSTHQEWGYVPYSVLNPFCRPPQCTASRKGERVALYFTLAWLDRYLKGESTALVRGDEDEQRDSARGRLLGATFDPSVDGSSIGQGAWDAVAQRNVPYTIAGEAIRDHLSFYYRSSYSFDGFACDDWRGGCTAGQGGDGPEPIETSTLVRASP